MGENSKMQGFGGNLDEMRIENSNLREQCSTKDHGLMHDNDCLKNKAKELEYKLSVCEMEWRQKYDEQAGQ